VPVTIGVISDTHGLVRPEALDALRGVDQILHAGDIGSPEVLEALRALAPVTAVRGNNDRDAWARTLPESLTVTVAGRSIFLLHDVHELDPASAASAAAVVAGHSHRPAVTRKAGVLYFNPGSAGPRRFKLPITVGLLRIGRTLDGEIIELALSRAGDTSRG
jgi:putative phosphoesterase